MKILKSESQRQNLRINLRWKEIDYSSVAEKKFGPYIKKSVRLFREQIAIGNNRQINIA